MPLGKRRHESVRTSCVKGRAKSLVTFACGREFRTTGRMGDSILSVGDKEGVLPHEKALHRLESQSCPYPGGMEAVLGSSIRLRQPDNLSNYDTRDSRLCVPTS